MSGNPYFWNRFFFNLTFLISTLPDHSPTLSSFESISSIKSPKFYLSIFYRYFSNMIRQTRIVFGIIIYHHNLTIMKSRTPFQPISQIKQNVTNKYHKNYCQNYHQKNLTLYQLQLDKIVVIQRWFRATINQSNRKKET